MSSASTRKRLPIRPSLEHLRKQAKRLARLEQLHVTEAQQQLAADYGFASWEALAANVESLRDRDESWRSDSSERLPKAAQANDLSLVRAILDAGSFTQHDLDLALARAILRFDERRAIADLLVQRGADPDGQYGADYGPIVFVTGEALVPDALQFLIDHGADVTFSPVDTKYGRHCPLSYVLGSYVRGHNAAKHRAIAILLDHTAYVPPEVTPPVMAIHRGDAEELASLLADAPALARQTIRDLPYGNLPLAGATLLHCAVEFGELACVDLLLDRGADINARADLDGGVGQTPVFHAINTIADGNFYTLEHLRARYVDRIDLDVCAMWRGQPTPVTPLEYAEQAAQPSDRGDHRPRIADELALLRMWPNRPD